MIERQHIGRFGEGPRNRSYFPGYDDLPDADQSAVVEVMRGQRSEAWLLHPDRMRIYEIRHVQAALPQMADGAGYDVWLLELPEPPQPTLTPPPPPNPATTQTAHTTPGESPTQQALSGWPGLAAAAITGVAAAFAACYFISPTDPSSTELQAAVQRLTDETTADRQRQSAEADQKRAVAEKLIADIAAA